MENLFKACTELNRDGFTVFFNYSGHTKTISVSIHPGGWEKNKEGENIAVVAHANESQSILKELIKKSYEHTLRAYGVAQEEEPKITTTVEEEPF